MIVGLLLLAGVASFALTGFLRRYALKRNLLDVPGARSSHVVPTPRGGGLAIVLVGLAGLPVLGWLAGVAASSILALLGAGALVAVIGWLDDHGHVAARWRLLVHFLAAGWALAWLGGIPPLPMFGISVDPGWAGHVLAAVYLVWLLNLYNFMDGIDGIAGIEAITVCLGGALLYGLVGAFAEAGLPLLLLASTGGFLIWNFPRARIFMGDAGSGFLGMMLGVLSLQAARVEPVLFWGWVILLGVFVVDATLTLLRRILRGERFFEAHRSHAYQHAARRFRSHIPVSLVVGAINVFWLLPISVLVVGGWLDGVVGVLVAYLPLVGLAIRFRAGNKE